MSIAEAGVALAEIARVAVEGLVERPADVRGVLGRTERAVVLTVTVADSDVGRALGRDGKTVRSLRSILAAVAKKHGVFCEFSINGEES